jgi:hypothetical protein
MITESARRGATDLALDSEDVESCIISLTEADFYKAVPSFLKRGLMQDVYRTKYLGFQIYLKLQIDEATQAVVISFKRDQSR